MFKFFKLKQSNFKVFLPYFPLYPPFFFKLEYSWFIMLCQFQAYSKVNQLYMYIHTHIYTHTLFLLASFLIQAITECSIGIPVLYSRFLLFIYFIQSGVYMPITISKFILLPLIPWQSSVCLLHLWAYFCLVIKSFVSFL